MSVPRNLFVSMVVHKYTLLLVDDFIYSHRLSELQCIDLVCNKNITVDHSWGTNDPKAPSTAL